MLLYFLDSFGHGELSVIKRCPYYRGVRNERFHCVAFYDIIYDVERLYNTGPLGKLWVRKPAVRGPVVIMYICE